MFFIELTYVSQYYYNWKQAEQAKSRAIELSALEINLTGERKRVDRRICFYFTFFRSVGQTDALPGEKHVAVVTRRDAQIGGKFFFERRNSFSRSFDDFAEGTEKTAKRKKKFFSGFQNLSLNDDVVLNEIQFDVEHSSVALSVVEQLTLLLVMFVEPLGLLT